MVPIKKTKRSKTKNCKKLQELAGQERSTVSVWHGQTISVEQ